MANKTYTVVKDGEELKELKSLAAAKKLADAEGAEVICDGKCVYQGTVAPAEDTVEEAVMAEEVKPETYTLLRKMNVRKEPSLNAAKLRVLDAGAVVGVKAIQNDWLCLTDGSFILYENGKNARKQG
jgi:hypothetical protein